MDEANGLLPDDKLTIFCEVKFYVYVIWNYDANKCTHTWSNPVYEDEPLIPDFKVWNRERGIEESLWPIGII